MRVVQTSEKAKGNGGANHANDRRQEHEPNIMLYSDAGQDTHGFAPRP